MLGLFIGFLTVVLVLDCMMLILLVLVQLPKKEAGMGQAFGGGATDALFGAGSGNALTKLTKWAAGVFFALAIVLTLLANYATSSSRGPDRLQQLMNQAPAPTPPPAAATTNTAAPTPPPKIDLSVPQTPPPTSATNTAVPGATPPSTSTPPTQATPPTAK